MPRVDVSPLLIILAVALGPSSAAAKPTNLAPNPSFEIGRVRPDNWSLTADAAITVSARSGKRSIFASVARAVRVAFSDPVPISSDQSYRMGGWLRLRNGRARIGFDVQDAVGSTISAAATPWAGADSDWRYLAVERDMAAGATTLRLWWEIDGAGDLDDVCLVAVGVNMVYNPTFDADSRGRVGMWGEETAGLITGKRSGSQAASTTGGITGSALQISTAPSDWYGSRVVPANLMPGVRTYRFSGWSKPESGQAQIRLVWLDADEKVIRADALSEVGEHGGWRHFAGAVTAPAVAVQVAVSAIAIGGKSLFDDFSLLPDRVVARRTPVIRVLANQVGYEPGGPMSVVVATNFVPKERTFGWLEIETVKGNTVQRFPIVPERIYEGDTADWGSYFWRADSTAPATEGTYSAVAEVGGVRGQSFPFVIEKNVLIKRTGSLSVDFFFVQRCGFEVPGWHKACHLDDAKLPDGRHIDATGGWHSAGDYNKIMYENGDGGVAYALLKAYDAMPDLFRKIETHRSGRPDILDEALWGAKFVAKMQNADGGLYKDIRQGPARTWMKWSPPDVHTDNVIGTADDPLIDPGEGYSPFAPAVWMRLRMINIMEREYLKNDFAIRAVNYWMHLTANGAGHGSPQLLLTAVDLHKLVGAKSYFEFAHKAAETQLAGQQTSGRHVGAWGAGGELTAGALAYYALAYSGDPLVPKIRQALDKYTGFLATTADNPFGLSKQSVGEKEYYFEPTSALGLNFNQLQKAWACTLIYRLNSDARARRIAADQIDWVLGKNPYDLCQCEGAGSRNPPRYHHRYDSIPGHERGAVPGCVPNGFVRDVSGEDRPGFDMSRPAPGKRHASYRTSEPWLVHNMWYLMAISALRP